MYKITTLSNSPAAKANHLLVKPFRNKLIYRNWL